MVEGLTTFSTDQGSGADLGSTSNSAKSKIFNRRLARDRSGRAGETQPTQSRTNPGDTGGEATPVPIPNTEVKLSSAEDTERAAFRENRSSPGFLRFRSILAQERPGQAACPAQNRANGALQKRRTQRRFARYACRP